jgi:hypothetical protein
MQMLHFVVIGAIPPQGGGARISSILNGAPTPLFTSETLSKTETSSPKKADLAILAKI